MMLLNQYGKPLHPERSLIAPEWLMREQTAILRSRCADLRVYHLRESILGSQEAHGIGDTVRVALPPKFRKDAFEQVGASLAEGRRCGDYQKTPSGTILRIR